MNVPLRFHLLLFLLLCWNAVTASAQLLQQRITMRTGWNAVLLEVEPTVSPDEFFASWPTDSVAIYDPAVFLATRQFSATWVDDGLELTSMNMWHRLHPDATLVKRVPGGSICVFYNEGSAIAQDVVGMPVAPRTTWHLTTENQHYNFVGISVKSGQKVSPLTYFEGFDGLAESQIFRLAGTDRNSNPRPTSVAATSKTVGNGDVLVIASNKISDWSGVLYVSPMNGLALPPKSAYGRVSVRNDGNKARTVTLRIHDPYLPQGTHVIENAWIFWRDADQARLDDSWHAVESSHEATASKLLEPGETWTLELGIDRSLMDASLPRGTLFGKLLTFYDLDGGTQMEATIPLSIESSGQAVDNLLADAGLWVADVNFTRASSGPSSDRSPGEIYAAGGTFKARLPVHIDATGTIRLLQRLVVAGTVDSDNLLTYHLYAGSAAVPDSATLATRISSVVLPTETPVIPACESNIEAGTLAFEFRVGDSGSTSLLRHPLHPQHDGLKWDFTTPAPSGDSVENYLEKEKPETFSVQNRIQLDIVPQTSTPWMPMTELEGTCTWTFTGVRHEGPLQLSGPMRMRKISPVSIIHLP